MIEKICVVCNKKYNTYNGLSKYCSQKCYLNNPNYKNGMKGKKRPDLSEYNRKYKSIQVSGENNPNKRKEVIEKRLKTVEGKRKEIYGQNGENNPNWKGGNRTKYSYKFNKELCLAVHIRDNFKCKLCKKNNNQTPQGLHTHHIDYNKKNNEIINLVSLCPTCHHLVEDQLQKHTYWTEYFNRELNVEKEYIKIEEVKKHCKTIALFLKDKNITGIVPVFRGGIVPAVYLSHMLNIPCKEKITENNDIVIDDIIDFGYTIHNYKKKYPKNLFICLHLNNKHFKNKIHIPDFYCRTVDKWIVYPWEVD